MQEYSDFESSRVYSYFRLCIDSIKDRLDLDTYNLGLILPHGTTITCVVKCYKKPRNKVDLYSVLYRDYALPKQYYCMIDIKRNNIMVKNLDDGETLFNGKTGVKTTFSDFVYGKVRKGLLKIPAKL
ncbi:MAG: hypothetical protein IJF83_07805 [Methanobrevibacter sp.]|nr:hypothetical protein [Methanobrevibacter sp.]MBR0371650.1 hypothetical protein [Methanobrevibacter sp.]